MKLKRSRASRRGRIEIIPMIDVMFFLLATFMLASLSMQSLRSLPVNLPKGHAGPMQRTPVTLTVTRAGQIYVGKTAVTLDALAGVLKPLLDGPDPSIVVNADAMAAHGMVTEAMLQAKQAGAVHFLIAVKDAH